MSKPKSPAAAIALITKGFEKLEQVLESYSAVSAPQASKKSKKTGTKWGSVNKEKIQKLLSQGVPVAKIAQQCGCSIPTVYNEKKKLEQPSQKKKAESETKAEKKVSTKKKVSAPATKKSAPKKKKIVRSAVITDASKADTTEVPASSEAESVGVTEATVAG